MYYFTFGRGDQLFTGGWVRINAATLAEAQEKFIKRYGLRAWRDERCWPNRTILNYAFSYTEEEFKRTRMHEENDNWGKAEHEYIP